MASRFVLFAKRISRLTLPPTKADVSCWDFFDGYRNGLLSVVQDVHYVFDDFFGESSLLLFGFSWPELHDDVRHCSLLRSAMIVADYLRYCSAVTCSIQSTTFPSFFS